MSQTKAQLISDLVQALNFTGTSSAPANGVYLNSANKIGLSTASANRLVVDPNGCVLIGGGTSSVTVGSVAAGLQLHSTVSTNGAQFSIARFNNDTAGGRLVLGKSRHSTTAGGTIVQAGDFAGIIEFAVDDGQDLVSRIAEIRAVVETGVAADDTPGYLSFRTTADNASSTSERVRIDKSGNAIFYNFTDNIGSSSSGEGFEFRRGEALRCQRDNGSALIVNRVSASGDIITLRDNATSIGSLGYDDTYTYLDTDASKPLALKVAGSTKLVINSNGEVLIGSTTDRGSQKLQVTGQITNGPSDNWSTTSSYYDIASYGGLTTQGSYEITLTAGGYRNGSGWVDYTVNSVSGYAAQIALNPVTGKIGFRTESGMSTGDTHTINERMMIDSNGYIGIKLTNPHLYYAKDLVVQAISQGGITVKSVNTTDTNYLMFADGTSGNERYRGYIGYAHNTGADNGEHMQFAASGGTGLMRFYADGLALGGETATANRLNDYEEGTWTPVPKLGSHTTGMTYEYAPAGVYTKIGRVVTVRFGWSWSSKGSSTGALQVTGLPFAATHSAYNHFTGSVIVFNGPNADGSMTSFISTSTINFRMQNEANDNAAPNETDVDNDCKMMGTITYQV